MATPSVIKGSLRRTRPATAVHLLPCEVEHNGKAAVGDYFEPLVQEEVDAKRALTLPIESVRDRVGKSAKARSGKAMQKREPDEPPPVLQSTFRGRRLKGRKIELPCDYVGVVLKQSRTAHSDGQHKTWEPLLKFDGFTYWNLDQLPTTNDPTVQAMEWIKLAESIHTDASPMPRRSPRKTPVKDYSHSGVGEEGSPRMKRSKLDVDG